MGIVTVLLLTLLVAGIPAAAGAGGVKITINSGGHFHRNPGHLHHFPRAQGHIHHVPQRPGVVHRHAPAVVVPLPVYVAAPRHCVVPGYWAYTWVPQSGVSHVWVPGHYNGDALWIEAHYEPRAYTWGYYQPYWVPERWTHC